MIPLLLMSLTAIAQADELSVLRDGATSLDYNAAGRGVNDTLGRLTKAFEFGLVELLGPVLAQEFVGPVPSWQAGRVEEGPVRITTVVPGEPLGQGNAAIMSWWSQRWQAFEKLDSVALKLLTLDAVSPERVAAHVRYEAVGTDADGARRVERARLQTTWTKRNDRYVLASCALVSGQVVEGSGTHFLDVAAERGIDVVGVEDSRFQPPSTFLRYQVIRHAVGGASAGDINADGWDDVLLTTGEGIKLYRNAEGRFEDVTEAAGLGDVRHVSAAAFADFDNDGDADLYLGRFYGHNLLFENTGAGVFRDVTKVSGFAQDDMTAVLAVADLNGDGILDVYVGRFLDARREVPDMILYTRNGAPNRVYFGRGDLSFEDVSERSGADDRGLTLGVGAADYDGDGDADLYLSNDYGRNVFFRNRGDGTFEDATLDTNSLAISGGMSVSWGDVDNDGRLDLYVSSIGSNQRWFSQDINIRSYVLNMVQSERRERLQELFLDLRAHVGDAWDQVGNQSLGGNYLLRQGEDGRFEDWSERSEARPQGWYWSSGFFDVDNDGHLDVFAVNGWITGQSKEDL